MNVFEEAGKHRALMEARLAKDPRDAQALIHLGFLEFEVTHDHEKAIEFLEQAIEYDPQNLEAYLWLAIVHYQDYCEYEKAKKVLFSALKINPYRADCLLVMAFVLRDVYKPEEAILYAEKAFKQATDWPQICHLLSTLYLGTGNIKLAEFYLKKGLELTERIPKKPKNIVEDYYESVITGRMYTKEKFFGLAEDLTKKSTKLLHHKGPNNNQLKMCFRETKEPIDP